MLPLIAGLGPTELLIILAVIILLFGASKLPELARGSGRALRIFKAETKGLTDDSDDHDDDVRTERHQTPEQREIRARQVDLDAEREAREQTERRQHGDTTT